MNLEETEDMARYILEIREAARPGDDPRRARHAHGHGPRRPGDGARLRRGRSPPARPPRSRPTRASSRPTWGRRRDVTLSRGDRCPAMLLQRAARASRPRRAAREARSGAGRSTPGPTTRRARRAVGARAARPRRRAPATGSPSTARTARVAARRPRRPGHRRGHASGIYPTSPAAEVEYLLGHSKTVVLIAEDEEQLDKALAVRVAAARRCSKIVVIDTRGVATSTTR